MRFAHISDLHIDSSKPIIYGVNPCLNLEKAISALSEVSDIEAVIISGDISNDGTEASYLLVDSMLSTLAVPVYCVLGNHDNKHVVENLLSKQRLTTMRFVSEVTIAEYRFMFLNSVKEDSPGENMSRGLISIEELQRIEREVSLSPAKCFLVMHHPAVEVGGWMDTRILINRDELKSLVVRHRNIVAVLAGHNHYSSESLIDGCLYSIAPSVSTSFNPRMERFREVYHPAIDIITIVGTVLTKQTIPL